MATPRCAHCNTASTTLLLCNNCKSTCYMYCNRDCQKANWKWHRATCKSITRIGDIVSISIFSNNPWQARAFPTFQQDMLECEAKGGTLVPPSGCYTERREPTGEVDLLVNEERYQELQRMEAEKKAEEKAAEEKAAEEKTAEEKAAG
jgi:hypothetical protein